MEETTQQPQPSSPPLPQPPATSKDERMWGMFCHLAALSGYVIPFGNIIGPLVVWMIKRDEYALVADQGKEALNFQITVWIALLCCFPLFFLCGIGAILAGVVAVGSLVFTIIAMVKANEGVKYRYPVTFRFIK